MIKWNRGSFLSSSARTPVIPRRGWGWIRPSWLPYTPPPTTPQTLALVTVSSLPFSDAVRLYGNRDENVFAIVTKNIWNPFSDYYVYRLRQYPSEHFIYTLHVYLYCSVVTFLDHSSIKRKIILLLESQRKLGLTTVYVSRETEL